MSSKLIVKFRRKRESSPPGCSLVSTALGQAFRDRQQRCHAALFARRFDCQLESFSRFECLRNLVRIASPQEVAYAAA